MQEKISRFIRDRAFADCQLYFTAYFQSWRKTAGYRFYLTAFWPVLPAVFPLPLRPVRAEDAP